MDEKTLDRRKSVTKTDNIKLCKRILWFRYKCKGVNSFTGYNNYSNIVPVWNIDRQKRDL